MITIVIYSASTSCGGRKPPNQDSFFVECGQSMYSADKLFLCGETHNTSLTAVFDGIGGGRCGDIVSRTAAKELDNFWQNSCGFEEDSLGSILLNAVAAVEAEVGLRLEQLRSEESVSDLSKEGCTMSAAVIAPDGHYAVLNVGDSPIFLVSGGQVSELSQKHTIASKKKAEGCSSDMITERDRHTLTCAINPLFSPIENAYLFGDFFLSDGDAIVITSDGVSENISQEELAALISLNGDSEEEQLSFELSAASRLIKAAKKSFKAEHPVRLFSKKSRAVKNRLDNCTSVVMYFHSGRERESKKVEK